MSEEDDTVDGGAANMRGPTVSGCERGRRVRGRGRCAGPARGLRTCVPVQGGRGWAGRLLLCARWEAAAMGLARLASLGRAAGCEAHFFFSFFCFTFLFHCLDSNLV